MRVASRIIGVALALAGITFFVVSFFIVTGRFDRKSVLDASGPDKTIWIAGSFAAVVGVGFILAGRYFSKLDVDAVDESQDRPPSRFATYFLAHRRELKLVAHVGLAISLLRLGALCFGVDWPGLWVRWILLLMWAVLPATDGRNARLRAGGGPRLNSIRNAGVAAICILVLLWAWSQYSHQQAATRISEAALMVLLFSWESVKTWSITASSR
jgi:hypothetical protein